MPPTPTPESIHVAADDLPFVELGDGALLKVLQVKLGEGLWIIENVFQAGYEVDTHKHTGPGIRETPLLETVSDELLAPTK